MLRPSSQDIVDAMAQGRLGRAERPPLPGIETFVNVLQNVFPHDQKYIWGTWQVAKATTAPVAVIGRMANSVHLLCSNKHGGQTLFIPVQDTTTLGHTIAQLYVEFENAGICVELDANHFAHDGASLISEVLDLRRIELEIDALRNASCARKEEEIPAKLVEFLGK